MDSCTRPRQNVKAASLRLIAALFALTFTHCAHPKTVLPARGPGATSQTTAGAGVTYRIDGADVTSEAYAAFRKSLKEVPHTWYCGEQSDGGQTGFQGTDASGARWRVTERSSSKDGNLFQIERIRQP